MIYDDNYRSFAEKSRTLYLVGEINANSVMEIIVGINILMTKDKTKPIKLYISSPGGDVSSGLALCDYITNIPTKVITIALGVVASMGTVIFICGDKRMMTRSSTLMLHDMIIGFSPKPYQHAKAQQVYIDRIRKTLVKLITSKTKITEEEMEDIMNSEKWFDSEESAEKELCDEIVGKDGLYESSKSS
jgi:ATP-dependent Clp protease protease subunit